MIRDHFILPDVQISPEVKDFKFLECAGNYVVEHKPSTIICIGDFWDMASLSCYDVGKIQFEGRRYINDIECGIEAMRSFLRPIEKEQQRLKNNKKKTWNPKLLFTNGNHENRINKAIENGRKLEGLISLDDLKIKEMGWDFYPFLKPVTVDQISYCHYFCSGVMGRPFSTALTMVRNKHQSSVMGHVQFCDISLTQRKADGTPLLGLFVGIYNEKDEAYLNPQTNIQHRQCWMIKDVRDGFGSPVMLPLHYLKHYYN